ncbi:hypothetical protein EJB05_15714 [Eragrostis curvula]|uniref:Uncharacterized protein n=1 Tax=Eragrostis curvula TaxID=38414 RepID=A0A5J9VCQ1_9POAL|nr:hypothetical protein EJB05_15714 [Eragrostis curvula]
MAKRLMEINLVVILSVLILGCFIVSSHCRSIDQMDSNKFVVMCPCPKMDDVYCCSDDDLTCYSSRLECRHYCCPPPSRKKGIVSSALRWP